MLLGKFFDDRGNTMSPTYAKKRGLRYRYYVSRALVEGRRQDAGTVSRVAADQIEAKVIEILKPISAGLPPQAEESKSDDPRDLIRRLVDRVTVEKDQLTITLLEEAVEQASDAVVHVPWARRPGRPKREVIASTSSSDDKRPIRSETRATLLRAIALGRLWLQELVTSKTNSIESIAAREDRSSRSVQMTISLAFLAPDIVEAAVAGRLPRGIGITRLTDMPPDWSKQREALGLSIRL